LQISGFAAKRLVTVYMASIVALRNSSQTPHTLGVGVIMGQSENQMSSTQDLVEYHSGATVAFDAYFQIFGSKTFDIVYKKKHFKQRHL
jgi:hypothetical protein